MPFQGASLRKSDLLQTRWSRAKSSQSFICRKWSGKNNAYMQLEWVAPRLAADGLVSWDSPRSAHHLFQQDTVLFSNSNIFLIILWLVKCRSQSKSQSVNITMVCSAFYRLSDSCRWVGLLRLTEAICTVCLSLVSTRYCSIFKLKYFFSEAIFFVIKGPAVVNCQCQLKSQSI